MNKEFILLSTSKKYRNICVAGIETHSGNWIRIVSDDDSIRNAVKLEEMLYQDGMLPQIFDIISVRCRGQHACYYQTENYVNNPKYKWSKTGFATIYDVINLRSLEKKEYIFYDNEKKIHKDVVMSIPEAERYSLYMVSPALSIVHVKEWPERKDITMSIYNQGQWYRYLAITDSSFKEKYLHYGEGEYPMRGKVYLVLSLGECYTDGCHYKLIVTVIS